MQFSNNSVQRWFLLFILLASTSACVTEPAVESRQAREFSEVAVLSGDFEPRRGDRFAWYSPIIWASDALPETTELRTLLMQLVEAELKEKGYQVVGDVSEADYVIGAAVVDKDNQAGETVRHFFNLFPSIKGSRNLPESMALIGVIRPEDVERIPQLNTGNSIALWRAAIIANVLGDQVSTEARAARFKTLTQRLMKSLPRGV